MICFALSHGTSAANVSDDRGDGQDSIAGALAGLSVGLFLIRWRSVRGFLDSGFTGRWRAYDENDQNRPTSDAHDLSTARLPRAYGGGSVRLHVCMVTAFELA